MEGSVTKIHVIRLGFVNVFIIQGQRCILVDTGVKKKADEILRKAEKFNINPDMIDLIVLTHGHGDHTGSLKELKERTGAKALIGKREYATLMLEAKDDIKPIAPIAKFIFWINDLIGVSPTKFEIPIEILVDDTYDLNQFGIQGKIVQTPGHSSGSISVLLEDGSAIIGDSLVAMMPWSKLSIPALALSVRIVKESVLKLIEMGASRFYLSNGKDYSLEDMKKVLDKM